MTDTNTAEREAFEAHCLRTGHSSTSLGKWGEVDDVPTSMRGDYIMRNIQNAWLAFQAGRASLAANAGSEPVAHLWQHSETGRTRVVMLDAVTDADASWLLVGPLCLGTHPSPPEGMAGQALRQVLSVVQRYLPPDGPSAHDAMSEITAIVDPWPLGPLEKP